VVEVRNSSGRTVHAGGPIPVKSVLQDERDFIMTPMKQRSNFKNLPREDILDIVLRDIESLKRKVGSNNSKLVNVGGDVRVVQSLLQ